MTPRISRSDVVDSLALLRQEWQASIDGESLIDVQASVGLLLGDVVMMLDLSSDEQVAVLGEEQQTGRSRPGLPFGFKQSGLRK